MDFPLSQLTSLIPMEIDLISTLKFISLIAAACLTVSVLGRMVFGKHSALNHAIASSMGIVFVYVATIVIYTFNPQGLSRFLAPLPFVSFSGTRMTLFSFSGSDYTLICAQVLSMVILAFLANIFEGILPKGKHFIGWLFFRCLGIVLAMATHLVVTWLFNAYLPQGLVTYAPTILLALLVLLLLVGALKIVVGAVLATVHPLIGAFYTFFFATIVGKALSKAVLTTAILSGIIVAMNYIGVHAVSIAGEALIAYVPFLIVLVVIWYVVSRVL